MDRRRADAFRLVDGGDGIRLVFDEACDIGPAINLINASMSVTVDGSAGTFGRHNLPEGLVDFTIMNLLEISPNINSGQTVIVSYTDLTARRRHRRRPPG